MITLVALLLFAGLYLGLLILIVFLAIRSKTVGGRIASIAAGVVFLMIVPLFFILATFAIRSSPVESVATRTMPAPRVRMQGSEGNGPLIVSESIADVSPPRPVTPPVGPAPAAPLPANDQPSAGTWTATELQPLKADVYPSYSAAIVSHLANVRETLIAEDVLYRDEQGQIVEPESILVKADGADTETLVAQSTGLISEQFPGVEIRSNGKGWPDSANNQLSIHLILSNVVRQVAAWDQVGGQNSEHSVLTFEIQADDRKTSFQCFVTEKPWVESFDRFVSMYPKRRFIVGYSSGLHSSEGQARSAAMTDAVRQAAITVNGTPFTVIDERHVVDRFAQRLKRDYGEVWREAVLVEIPDSNQIGVARATVVEQFHRSAMGRISQYVGIAVVVIVTILLCLLLNWGTQGYYRRRVLLGLTGVVIAGLLVTVLFVS